MCISFGFINFELTDTVLTGVKKDDKERRKWSQDLYGIDASDPNLYDMVIYIKRLTVGDAVDMICDSISKNQFKTTPESQRIIDDLAMSAAIHIILIDVEPDIRVYVDKNTAFIETQAAICAEESLVKEIREVTETFEGISDVKITLLFSGLDYKKTTFLCIALSAIVSICYFKQFIV